MTTKSRITIFAAGRFEELYLRVFLLLIDNYLKYNSHIDCTKSLRRAISGCYGEGRGFEVQFRVSATDIPSTAECEPIVDQYSSS